VCSPAAADYQNIAVNGARVHTMLADIMPSFQRSNLTDQPVNVRTH